MTTIDMWFLSIPIRLTSGKRKSWELRPLLRIFMAEDLSHDLELSDVGFLMAMTGNDEINNHVIKKFRKQFGEHGTFRLITVHEMNNFNSNPIEGLFSHTHDFNRLDRVAEKYPQIWEAPLKSKEHFTTLIEQVNQLEEVVSAFH